MVQLSIYNFDRLITKGVKFAASPHCLYLIRAERASDTASSASRDLTSLRTSRTIASDSTWLTHVLLVTTTVRVVHRVHCHTSDLGPLVALDSVLVERTTSLQDRFVGSSTASNQTNHSSA